MAKIKIEKKHGRSQKEALSLAKKLTKNLAKDYDLKHKWNSDGVVFSRSGVKGEMLVDDENLSIELELSLPVSLLKGKIESRIKEELKKILS